MEILDLFNKDGVPLNKTIVRGDKNFGDDEFIKISTIWINCKDKFLIQKTSKEKDSEYAVSGGHIPSGKSPREQAIIELNEELGIAVESRKLTHLGNIIIGHVIFVVFLLIDNDLTKEQFHLQNSEVEDILWLNKDEIESLIQDKPFRKSSAMQYEKFIKNI